MFVKEAHSSFVLLFLGACFLPQLRNQTLEFKTFPPRVTFLLFFILQLVLATNSQTSAKWISKTLIILKKNPLLASSDTRQICQQTLRECCLQAAKHTRSVFTSACRYQALLRVMTFLNTISIVLCDTNQI